MTAAIQTTALTKQFGKVAAVTDLSLEVDRGGVFGFLGPNGAGKTTTIRLLLGFLRPTRGAATVLGGTGADPRIRARIGYLPGDLRLPPSYTAKEAFEFYGAVRGGIDARRWGALAERLELDPSRRIGELSTGNRRKVGIVCAFMPEPELLVLDEPTSGLDPLLQRELLGLVRERAAQGATVFLSSHVLPEVERVADRVAILRGGRLLAVFGVEELRRRARQRLELEVSGPVDAARFAQIPGVVEAVADGGTLRLVVEGSVDAVLKAASELTVVRITSREANLEEVFFSLFQGDG